MDASNLSRHVKMVCTLGPASRSREVIARMILAGMNVARLNLNYGTLEEHAELIREVRSLSKRLKTPVALLLDLPGQKRCTGSVREAFGEHLQFARTQGADFVALSFITSEQQVREALLLMKEMEAEIPIVVKIERAEALKESSAIIKEGHSIMVARGDLALGISIEKVPLAQKRLIREANRWGRPVITATQMLLSMVDSATPTRAEATDVANAVLDGTDALMLSEETAIGKYPVAAVETMARIAAEAETGLASLDTRRKEEMLAEVNDAAARAACQMGEQVGAKAIIAFTTGGTTALRLSKYRPWQPILAVTPYASVERFLTMVWGVHPIIKPESRDLETVFKLAVEVARETGVAGQNDLIIITAGLPLAVPGNTNLLKVHRL